MQAQLIRGIHCSPLKMVHTCICCYKMHSPIKSDTVFLMKAGAKKSFSTGLTKVTLGKKMLSSLKIKCFLNMVSVTHRV